MKEDYFSGGFENAPAQCASVFRAVLMAMARPGTLHEISYKIRPPALLSPTTAAVVLTLADQDTPLWLSPALTNRQVESYIKFHTGAPLVGEQSSSTFAVFKSTQRPELSTFSVGTAEYPDKSATLILQIDEKAAPTTVSMQGPGIEHDLTVSLPGLDQDFWHFVQTNHQLYPRGLDFLFCLSDGIIACPRTSKITIEGEQ